MRRGVLFGLIAYGVWGLFPLYWPLLAPASAPEILAHRIFWSFVVMSVVLTVLRRWKVLRSLPARTWLQVATAAVLIAINWGVYIYAVNNGHIVEAALGYYMNPLVSIGLAVVVLHERLRPLQWVAIAVAAVAVLVITLDSGSVPWIGFTLALSFALYGLVKKLVPLQPAESLSAESLVLMPAAVAFASYLTVVGSSTLTGHGGWHVVLLAGSGLVTIVPLAAFAIAAQALPLSVLGFTQYLTPTVQFLLGVLWAREHMQTSRWIGFGIIWVALAIYTADALNRARRIRGPAVPNPVPAATAASKARRSAAAAPEQ